MNKSMYREFRRKMVVITLLISFVPLTLLGYTLYYGFSRAYHQRIEQQMIARVNSCAQSLNLFLEERMVILSAAARSGSMAHYNDSGNLRALFDIINSQTGGGLVDIGVIDSQGNHLAYVGPYTLEGLNYRDQPWFNLVIFKGSYISDVFMGYRQLPHFVVAVKASDKDGDWILRATIDPNIFARIVSTAQTGKSGDAFVINRSGRYQSKSRFVGNELLTQSNIDTSLFGSNTTIISKNDGPDLQRMYAGTWIKNGEWLLVVSQATDEKFLSFSNVQMEEVMIFLIAVLAIVVTAVVTTGLSVDKLQERDREMDAMNAQLIQTDKLAALGKMAAGVAHEINNPLGIISTQAGWMKDLLEEEDIKASPNYQEFVQALQKIEVHVERAGKVTRNMLGFARSMEPSQEKIDINATVKQTLDFLGHHAQINNIDIITDLDPTLPEISSDRSQLQQVFLNIINNAIDAIEKQGSIHVRTRRNDDRLTIAIEDTGMGIPESMLSRIFDPFFTTKEKDKGTGLGLSITYKIIDSLGGSIDVRSKVGEGTCFTITLPMRPDAAAKRTR
ncbi:MAG: ATP-binding protein [Pseudomonadota bacterium]